MIGKRVAQRGHHHRRAYYALAERQPRLELWALKWYCHCRAESESDPCAKHVGDVA